MVSFGKQLLSAWAARSRVGGRLDRRKDVTTTKTRKDSSVFYDVMFIYMVHSKMLDADGCVAYHEKRGLVFACTQWVNLWYLLGIWSSVLKLPASGDRDPWIRDGACAHIPLLLHPERRSGLQKCICKYLMISI